MTFEVHSLHAFFGVGCFALALGIFWVLGVAIGQMILWVWNQIVALFNRPAGK